MATELPRIPVKDVTPLVEHGRRPAKASIGEAFDVTAVVFRDGHDAFGADVVLTDPSGVRRAPVRMRPDPDPSHVDRYVATVVPDAEGAWTFEVVSWSDPLATWRRDTIIKVRAGVDVELMFAEGVEVLRRASGRSELPTEAATVFRDTATALQDTGRPVEARLAAVEAPELAEEIDRWPIREFPGSEGAHPFFTDRRRALFSAWYEFFPRSEGGLRGSLARLPAIAEMGFDIVYLPPIHPIGEVNRKGRNNTLEAEPGDVGSPWAIGSRYGGHDAVHPELGTLADFDAFVARANELGLEVALDLALQAAPDHPWVGTHPEWFTTRVDGSIAYAENPPKKYQDIYPINFDNDPDGIAAEVERVVRHWMAHGVRIFRVDNPHTKPLRFWEGLLDRIRATDPDVLFLSEAFTKPPMMQALAAAGFHQSYTYFAWRNTKQEIEEYLAEVARETSHVMRPSFWPNTPDILHEFLQYGGPPAFRIRAVLAATGSPSWGIYSGYELYERVALRPGSEEYLDSEKYQIRKRDWAAAEQEGQSLAPYLTRLNEIRRAHPALQQLRDLTVHRADDDAIVCFSKRAGDDVVVAVINLDPHNVHETTVHLDLAALGLDPDETFEVQDELTQQIWRWGEHNYVRLDPADEVAHVLAVRSVR